MQGAEAVIRVLGPAENKPTFLVNKGTQHILTAMKQHGIHRLVLSAGAGVADPAGDPKFSNRLINLLLKTLSRRIYQDMVPPVQPVRHFELDWTIVCVPRLIDDKPTGEIKFSDVGRVMGFPITRSDMARTMLDLAEGQECLQQAPAVSN